MSLFLSEYQKLKLIGKGAFASIWKVRHKDLGYVRAIKVSNEVVEDENDKAYQTFLKECRVLLKIGNGCHPNIVRIYQPRLIDNKAIVEMDYVDGCTVNEWLQQHKFMPIDDVKRFFTQIVGALAYCHVDIYQYLMNPAEDNLKRDPNDANRYIIGARQREALIAKYGITHNDLHSNNVMRRNYDGGFVLLDFGLAIQNGRSVKSSSRRDGALEYRAPEKWDNESIVTTQSDIYSLGVLLYEVLAGRVPFVYDPTKFTNELQCQNAMYHAHCEEQAPAIEPLRMAAFKAANPGKQWVKDYPDWLEAMIMKCLEKEPAKRYANAKELLADFNRHLAEDEKQRKQEQEQADLTPTVERLKKKNESLMSLNRTLQDREVAGGQLMEKLKAQLAAEKRKQAGLETEKKNLREELDSVTRLATQLKSKLEEVPKPKVKTVTKTVKVVQKRSPWGWIAATIVMALLDGAAVFAPQRLGLASLPGAVATTDTVFVTDDSQSKKIIDDYKAQLATAKTEIKSLKEQISAGADTKESNTTTNTDEVARLQARVSKLESDNKSLQANVSKLVTENKNVKSENSTLRTKNQKLQAQVDAFIKNFGN